MAGVLAVFVSLVQPDYPAIRCALRRAMEILHKSPLMAKIVGAHPESPSGRCSTSERCHARHSREAPRLPARACPIPLFPIVLMPEAVYEPTNREPAPTEEEQHAPDSHEP
jgi:hypothetical protein